MDVDLCLRLPCRGRALAQHFPQAPHSHGVLCGRHDPGDPTGSGDSGAGRGVDAPGVRGRIALSISGSAHDILGAKEDTHVRASVQGREHRSTGLANECV